MLLTVIGISVAGTVLYARRASSCSTLYCSLPLFVALLIVQTICLISYHLIIYPFYLSPLRHLPSVKQAPVWRRLTKEPNKHVLSKWLNETPNDGLIRYFGVFNRERILITRTQGCKEVLQLHAYNFIKSPWALEVMGQVTPLGVLVSPTTTHKVDRKLLQPAFRAPYIKTLYPIFWSETTKFIKMIEQRLPDSGSGRLDIGNLLHHVTLDIITLTGFGGSLDAVANPESEHTKQYKNLFSPKRSHMIYRLWAIILPSWLYRQLPVQARKEIKSAIEYVHGEIKPLIEDRRESAKSAKKGSALDAQGDIITTLLNSGHDFTNDYLIDQAISLIMAGQETTASAVAFALYLLSEHPEVQTRLREEVRSKLISPDLGMPVNNDDIEAVPYLTAVCNEVLRLYPTVPDTRRESIVDTVIEGTLIPAGVAVVPAAWAIHRSKAIWGPTAEQFIPERWFVPGSNGTKIDPLGGAEDTYSMMTFTYGARACIGEKFAKGEMLTLVAQLVGRFDWEFMGIGPNGDQKMRVFFGITLTPVGGGMTMSAKKISGW